MAVPQTPPELTALRDHLRAEEDLLRAALRSLADLHSALRTGDAAAVDAARPAQQHLAAALAESAAARAAALAAVAASVGLPPSASLADVAARVPDAADLPAARVRLRALAAEVQAAHRRNATLVRYLRSSFRGVLAALDGGDAPARYGRLGTPLAPATGVVVRVHG